MQLSSTLWITRGVLVTTLAGCGYGSRYSPPIDGRARPLWSYDHVVNNLDQLDPRRACAEAVFWTANPDDQHVARRASQQLFWIPVYYGPSVVARNPGVAPTPPPRVVFSRVPPSKAIAPPIATDSFDDLLRFPALYVVMLLFVLWPPIAVTLAAARPEQTHASVEAIDLANAYNDLARSPGSPCEAAAP